MYTQPRKVEFELPAWVGPFMASYPAKLSVQDRMRFVIEASRTNDIERTGGPFGAAIFEIETGKLISLGVNLVTTQSLSMLHDEMVAICMAQRIIGTYDLGGKGLPDHELVTSAEPCAMCFGAIPWSGVRRVVIGARSSDAEAIGFDEGPKTRRWREELEKRGIQVICDVHRYLAAMMRSPMIPNPVPRTIWPASHPATRPTTSMIRRL
jgi:tRNA(Arg) A34 adenosine deaminase TadA